MTSRQLHGDVNPRLTCRAADAHVCAIKHRAILAAGAASVLPLPIASAVAGTSTESGLNALAKAKGMRVGSAYAWSAWRGCGVVRQPCLCGLLRRDCGVLVAENKLKWQSIRPDATRFDFGRFDAMLAWADAAKLPVRGHNLLWHRAK